ncbi:E3 ubiquitin-protein ligase at1g12760-like protein [Trifolium pratense]|uniref:RING-type E3 ubiquitin transferase n=1 Tax=Trifolium pratense TaxID=57577 RepID=A0A2K3PI93_TRIPR|nr:E3 ubiquitin-protein ligase at1g12760-like protein [Trifolium pratense]
MDDMKWEVACTAVQLNDNLLRLICWEYLGEEDHLGEHVYLRFFRVEGKAKAKAELSYSCLEGATKEDIEQLSKFKFQRKSKEKLAGNTQGPVGGIMIECQADSPIERVLADEDAECCICLSAYDDGVELRQLPCGHHFHCTCVDKWLQINATCPLCKYNILKSSRHGEEEV